MTDNHDRAGIYCCSSSPTATTECAGHVVVSGSYAGEFNSYHAAKWGIRGVVMNDAGIGKNNAGIKGLPYLDSIGLPGAAADANTCHIADGEDILENGVISFLNDSARAVGVRVGQTVQEAAVLMRAAPVNSAELPEIEGGKRYLISHREREPKVVCLDGTPLLDASDSNAIAVTGSHAGLFRGRPDNVIHQPLRAIFFSDAGVGKDDAGIARLWDLDKRKLPAGAVSVQSAEIGNSRDILEHGILSHINASASHLGVFTGMSMRDCVELLVSLSRI